MNLDKKMISDIRTFNRYYTNILGILDKHVFQTGYSLTEARVILEIGFRGECIANHLVDKLDIDRSYMSRIVAKLSRDGLLNKSNSPSDSRISLIRLTDKGNALFKKLNEKSDEQIIHILQGLSQQEIEELHSSMLFIQNTLNKAERKQDDSI
ncbi:MarR family winged helix-turn-helix transcriptional regulator [Neobacillus mesonae]|nr:MarR family winged helix-turn-helix transcriptional regulator [Neobacillus mesonae]